MSVKPLPVLRPLTPFYRAALMLRQGLRSTGVLPVRRLPIPVVSVGNIRVGGTGKTPCVLALAEEARRRGRKPVILTRGYGGRRRGPVFVSDTDAVRLDTREAGDEAVLLARRLPGIPVVKSADRYEGGRLALQRCGDTDLFLLDDGFQHRRLARDVDIVLHSWTDDPAERRLLPAGPLREPLGALGRADEIVLSKSGDRAAAAALEGVRRRGIMAPVSRLRFDVEGVSGPDGGVEPAESLAGRGVVAFCGLARPVHFRRTLEEAGIRVLDFVAFPDHHAYSRADIEALRRRVDSLGADGLLTTEKDGVKLGDERVPALRIRAVLEKAFLERVFSKLESA